MKNTKADLQGDLRNDLRWELATKILSRWELLQIMEHQSGASGVAKMALDLADELYRQAEARWYAD